MRFSALAALVCAVVVLAGCGGTGSNGNSGSGSSVATGDTGVTSSTGSTGTARTVNHVSRKFCQRLSDGRWTYNIGAGYYGPCKVDVAVVNSPPGDVEARCSGPRCTATPGHSHHRKPKPKPS